MSRMRYRVCISMSVRNNVGIRTHIIFRAACRRGSRFRRLVRGTEASTSNSVPTKDRLSVRRILERMRMANRDLGMVGSTKTHSTLCLSVMDFQKSLSKPQRGMWYSSTGGLSIAAVPFWRKGRFATVSRATISPSLLILGPTKHYRGCGSHSIGSVGLRRPIEHRLHFSAHKKGKCKARRETERKEEAGNDGRRMPSSPLPFFQSSYGFCCTIS